MNFSITKTFATLLAGALLAPGLMAGVTRAATGSASASAGRAVVPPGTQPSARVGEPVNELSARDLQDWKSTKLDDALLGRLSRDYFATTLGTDDSMLLRRLSLDLTGTMPTSEQFTITLADPSPEARARLVRSFYGEVARPTTTAPATQPTSVADALAYWITAGNQARPVSREYTLAINALRQVDEPKVKAPYMGVGVDAPNDTVRAQLKLAEGAGLVVNYVDSDGPAKDIIRQHDVLQKLEDQILINAPQLVTLVRMHKPGEAIQVTVIREARPVNVTIKLAEKDLPPLSTYLSQQQGSDPVVSAEVRDLEDAVRATKRAGNSADATGVWKGTFTPDQNAAQESIKTRVDMTANPGRTTVLNGGSFPYPLTAINGSLTINPNVVGFASQTGPYNVTTTTNAGDVVYLWRQQPQFVLSAVDRQTGAIVWQLPTNLAPVTQPATQPVNTGK